MGRRVSDLYFAYGSNLDDGQMRDRCPQSAPWRTATLPDHHVAFTRWSTTWNGGVADVVAAPGGVVWGLLYRMADSDWKNLDRAEGVHVEAYRRHPVVVHANRTQVEALTYVVVVKKPFVEPSPAYLDVILTSATRLGFPDSYVAAIRRAAGAWGE